MDDDVASNTLTLIARVSVGTNVSDGLKEKVAQYAENLPESLRQLGRDIIANNPRSETAQRYRKWALNIRRGAGNSERKRKELMDRINCTCSKKGN